MKLGFLVCALLVFPAAVLAACSAAPDAPQDAYRGTMTSGCAPHDAASTVIELAATEGEATVWFNLWPASGMAPPSTVEFDARQPIGQATFCTTPDACEPADWGTVVLESPAGTGQVEGEWALGLADGRTVRGVFAAEWLAIQALCG
jgi:hypothetical protein